MCDFLHTFAKNNFTKNTTAVTFSRETQSFDRVSVEVAIWHARIHWTLLSHNDNKFD